MPDVSQILKGDAKSTPFLERRISLEYFEPRIFGWPVDARISLTHRKESHRSFSVLDNSAALYLDWWINRHWTYSPEYQVEYSNPFNIPIAKDTLQVDDPSPKLLHSFDQTVYANYLDDKFSPQKGFRTILEADLFDSHLGGDLNFWQTTIRQDFFYPLMRFSESSSFGIALSLNAGFSDAYSNTPDIPVEKRFRVGGEASVRGYPEDSIQPVTETGEPLRNGGQSMFYFQSELNIPVVGSLDLLGFFDGGNIYATNSKFDPFNLRYGVGGGIRFNTPIGPMKLGYAFIVQPRENENRGRIYFGIGPL